MTATAADRWLVPDRAFDGARLGTGLCLGLAGGRVVALAPLADLPASARRSPVKGTIVPGYLDLQVNGGGGVMVNNSPTPEGLLAIAAAHRRFGTVGILPTVITDRPEVLARAVGAIEEAWGDPGLLGLHIEGPHLSLPRRGTHDAACVRPLDRATIAQVERLRTRGIPVMITLAPEAASADQIAALAATGAMVSLGHSDATADETRAALAAGAGCFTHLYNAMSPMLNRAPGMTGACINSAAFAGIICDGIHVADEMVGLAIRARPVADRMFLVSDAMPTVGGPDRFYLYGQEIRLDQGRLVNGEGSLAGAHVTLADSVVRLIGTVGIDPETALKMATTIPARVMGLDALVGLVGRRVEDLLVLDADWAVVGTCG